MDALSPLVSPRILYFSPPYLKDLRSGGPKTVYKEIYGDMALYCGFFLQDDPESIEDVVCISTCVSHTDVDDVTYRRSDRPLLPSQAIPPRFGLKDDSDDRWVKFIDAIRQLNVSAPSGTQYKVVFLGRHGEAYHNVGLEKYTLEEWMRTWTKQYGDGELVWGPDSELTEVGIEQAKHVHRSWKTELEYNIPLPEKLYTSPLRRAIKTNQVTFKGLLKSGLKTTIVENIREKNGVSTCHNRRKKSEIASDFPDYLFEKGFAEEDETWSPAVREPLEQVEIRAKKALDMIFDNDEEKFISITSHLVFIDTLLRVCGHHPWALPTGGVLPIILKAEQLLLN